MISSVRLAAKTESLYRQAALAIAVDGGHETTEKALRAIGEHTPMGMLGPVERAEVLRIFALRQLPIGVMELTLKATETLATATTVEAKSVAVFFADVYHAIGRSANTEFLPTVDFIYATIKGSPAPPEEFFEAFRECRHLLLSGAVDLTTLLRGVRDALAVGVPAFEVDSYISERHDPR
jgi:hypothetical protein